MPGKLLQDINPGELEPLITNALYSHPIDYQDQINFVNEQREQGQNCSVAGVLLLIQYQPDKGYVFLLNKRSDKVQQPGDLCCPGGSSNRIIDSLLGHLITKPLLAWRKTPAYLKAKQLGPQPLNQITFFLTNALRESWEEIRLDPFAVNFLGPLNCYRLTLFKNIIFPIVGAVKAPLSLKPNWEVAKILQIPLHSFFQEENYGVYRLKVGNPIFKDIIQADTIDYPCLIYQEPAQPTEILWGATYSIIMSFLDTVFGFHPPELDTRPVIEGELYPLS